VDEVSTAPEINGYNYTSFPLDLDMPKFMAFREDAPSPGDSAPDGNLTNAMTGEQVKLSDLWKKGHLVIEFGSIT
jgi:hypothetical protein